MRGEAMMSTDPSSQYFTPPRLTKPIDPILRYSMGINAKTIYVVFCGGFPTLTAHLCFQENVEVYRAVNIEELRELLTGANGIPADLVVINSYEFQSLPPLTFCSPVDGHESTVVFSLYSDLTKEGEVEKWYTLVDSLRTKKQKFVEGYSQYCKLHPEPKEDSEA